MTDSKKTAKSGEAKKAKYEKPSIKTESLTAVAALCNGTTTASRKASTSAPALCASNKLKS